MIVGLLGILKAGAAFVPLDPTLPKARLHRMQADSRMPLLVTTRDLSMQANEGVTTVCMEDVAEEASEEPSRTIPTLAHHAGQRVYVIYTSGSTGTPKGVEVTHANLINYIHAINARLGLPRGASYATVSTLSADLGHTALFPALCTGGCLHVISSERAMDAGLWRAYLQKHPIDCLKIIPPSRGACGERGDRCGLLPRLVLVLGGEASHWEFVDRVRLASPSLRVFNHYGPTETTVGVLTYALGGASESEHRQACATVPLGRPLGNVRAYVLNAYLQPVPVGVVGEVYIGGACVSRGYLNAPDLRRQKYFQSRCAIGAVTERLYRTGDLGRYLRTGISSMWVVWTIR